ncbi:hypothetical protein V6Z11_D07G175200 [Gossypium hirsutum]
MEKADGIGKENGSTEEKQSFKDGSICGYSSLHHLLSANLKPQLYQPVASGLNCGTALETIVPPELVKALSSKHEFDLQAFKFSADKELLREPWVRVGLIQNSIFVIIGNHGNIIGKHRKNHIPRVGDFNESTY